MRFYAHGDPVVRASDGRAGSVKDIEGVRVNIIWADDGSREWVPADELDPGGPA